MLTVVIGNSYSKIEGEIPSFINLTIQKTCSFIEKSAYHTKAYKEGWWDGRTYLYDMKTQRFPTGLVSDVLKLLKGQGVAYSLRDERIKPDKKFEVEWKLPFELREYQEEAAIVCAEAGRGRVKLPTASGKNVFYMNLIRKIGVRTLVVVNTIEALEDTYETAVMCFGKEFCGYIGNGSKKEGQFITVITMKSTLTRDKEFFKGYEAIIYDEAHRMAADSNFDTIMGIDCYYKFGGSGTQFRTDGRDIILQAVTGRVLYSVDTKDLQAEGRLVQADIRFVNINSEELPSVLFSDYHELYNFAVVENMHRNKLIVDIVRRHLGKSILILTNRITHGELLLEHIKQLDPKAVYVDGSTPKKIRSQARDDFKHKKLLTFLSSSIFDESVNVPCIEVIVMASAGTSGIKTIQRLGRGLRLHKNKTHVIYYDFIDSFNGKMKKQSMARMKELQKEGHQVKVIQDKEVMR